MMPTFTPSSPHYSCEHRGCHRPAAMMAWIEYVTPEPGTYRASGYHLCQRCADAWARDGVPTFALEWRHDWRGDVRVLLGAEPVKQERKPEAVATMAKGLELFA